jgi:hypothetical protein
MSVDQAVTTSLSYQPDPKPVSRRWFNRGRLRTVLVAAAAVLAVAIGGSSIAPSTADAAGNGFPVGTKFGSLHQMPAGYWMVANVYKDYRLSGGYVYSVCHDLWYYGPTSQGPWTAWYWSGWYFC